MQDINITFFIHDSYNWRTHSKVSHIIKIETGLFLKFSPTLQHLEKNLISIKSQAIQIWFS